MAPRPSLPRADSDAMEEYLGPARLLLAALGFTWLHPLARHGGSDELGRTGPLADLRLYFQLPKRGVDARGHSTDEGLVVLAGSKGDSKVRSSLSKGWRAAREDLIADGSIVDIGERVDFTRDVLFSSPSAAASSSRVECGKAGRVGRMNRGSHWPSWNTLGWRRRSASPDDGPTGAL